MKFDTAFNLLKTFQTDSAYSSAAGIKINVDQSGSVYLLGSGNSYVSFGDTTIYIWNEGYFLAKFSNDLGLDWAKVLTETFMDGMYQRYILFDQSQNLLMLHMTGGGGGSLNELEVNKFNSAGIQLSNKIVPVRWSGYMDVDSLDNVWVSGYYSDFVGPSYFSIVKVTPLNIIDTVFFDPMIGHRIKGLAVKGPDDFYIIGNCMAGNYLGDYTCSPQESVFLAHYGPVATNIEPIAQIEEFQISPNPSCGIFTIDLKKTTEMKICVYDVLGNCVYTSILNNNNQEINLSDQSKGVYFIKGSTGEKRIVKKIIVN
jgi:hypothetical protein